VVEQLYVAYFGRPADPQGLANFSAQLLSDGAPTNIQDLNTAYSTNASIKALIDTFGTSAESNALYGTGGNTAFVTAVFQNVLGRQPLAAGLNYWVNAISSGSVTLSNAALSIMAGAETNNTAQGQIDAALVANRLTVAANFSAAVSSPGQVFAYSGSVAAAAARTMLATVSNTTDVTSFQSTINTTVANLIGAKFASIQTIITQRCVPCHSSHPTEPGFNPAPDGVMLDTAAEIAQYAPLIDLYAVQQQTMPYGNITGMTSAERSTIGAWYTAGANE